MQPAILLSKSILAVFLLALTVVSDTAPCDTKWIRLVYMMSCGQRKRESPPAWNESFSEPLPTDVYGAVNYFRERDPTNPLFNEDERLLNEILHGDEHDIQRERFRPGVFIRRIPDERQRIPTSRRIAKNSLVRKLSTPQGNHLGIRGFPNHWDVYELADPEASENYRREIDRLLEECCRTHSESTCNGDTFRGACKKKRQA